MTEIIKRNKALSVMPLKSSQTIGAAPALLGLHRAIPMLHGSQGCTAFGKVFFVRHFREPIPLQTTAVDQVAAVMGPNDNVIEGLKTICEKSKPALIGVPTTGLTETQGSDVHMALREFRAKYPEFDSFPVVPVVTPDYIGCTETGFALATKGIIDTLVPHAEEAGTKPGYRKRQVNVLVGSFLTPGDIEELKELIEAFGLQPMVVPDLSDSLDGHLGDSDFSPLTIGGMPVSEMAFLGDSAATLVIGASQYPAADLLAERTGVPDHRFDHLMGLEAVDGFIDTLRRIAGAPVPKKIERQRAQLQDAMLDCHFMTGFTRVGIAADPDLLNALTHLVQGMGAEVAAAVSPVNAQVLQRLPVEKVKIGDLEDFERMAKEGGVELMISNSHALESAHRLGIPLLRAGFPQYDQVGGYQEVWIGYRGTRRALFDLANLILGLEKGEIHPYRSVYSQKRDAA